MSNKLILLILLACFCFSVSFAQEKEADLKDKKITIKMNQQHLALVFRHLMQNYDVPIGFEQSMLDRHHNDYAFETNSPSVGVKEMKSLDGKMEITIEAERVFEARLHWITVDAENERLEEVLNIIVGQMENYKWEINDGVVNIFPIRGRDERFEKLLGLNIKNFTFEKGETVRHITTKIITLPEIYKFLKENQLNFNGARTGSDIILKAQYGRTLDTEMNFSNLTFRELLNKITKIKKGGWILRKIGRATVEEYIDIDI